MKSEWPRSISARALDDRSCSISSRLEALSISAANGASDSAKQILAGSEFPAFLSMQLQGSQSAEEQTHENRDGHAEHDAQGKPPSWWQANSFNE